MEKIKTFINKYKAEILIALGAVSSIAASVATMDGVNAALCSITIAIVAALVEVLKNGFTDSAVLLLAKSIELIIEALKREDVVSVSLRQSDGRILTLSLDEIKRELEESLRK